MPLDRRRSERIVALVFRLGLAPLFVVSGLGHFLEPGQMIARLAEAPLGRLVIATGLAPVLMGATGVVLLAGGTALVLGRALQTAAIALFLVVVPITLTTHVGHQGNPGPLLKNVIVLVALVRLWSDAQKASE